jgi:DNA-binding beta-propeller fold protein YncE/mono/diheme cytochrome c family protein
VRILFLPVMAALTIAVPLGFEAAGAAQAGRAMRAAAEKPHSSKGPLHGLGLASGASSALALGRRGDTTFAFTADEDEGLVLSFALTPPAPVSTRVDSRRERKPTLAAATKIPGRPTSLLVTPSGKVVVAIRDRNKLAVLRASEEQGGALALDREIDVCTEPVGLALTPGGDDLAVACAWGNAIGRVSLAQGRMLRTTRVAREPRAVAFDETTGTAYVAHAVGNHVTRIEWSGGGATEDSFLPSTPAAASVVDASDTIGFGLQATQEGPVALNQGFTLAVLPGERTRVVLPQVAVRTNERQAREAATSGYGGGFAFSLDPIAQTDVGIYDVAEQSLTETRFRGSGGNCLLPRASAFDRKRGLLFVACFDEAHVNLYGVEGEDIIARESWRVGDGPTGLAWRPEEAQLVVWSAFDRVLTVIDSVDGEVSDSHQNVHGVTFASDTVERVPTPFEIGRKLFHATDHRGISNDGRACASCHPDGRDDGLVWSSPNGPRQTPTLAGRLAATAPFGWNGESETVKKHLEQTMSRLGGSGLHPKELYALLVYLARMPGPPPAAPEIANDAAVVAIHRGAEVFRSKETGCAGCHDPGYDFTDGERHDVGSQTRGDPVAELDTPSLRFVGLTAPYFHDGRFATLGALLRGVDGKMGRTGHLSEDDLTALEAYLASL